MNSAQALRILVLAVLAGGLLTGSSCGLPVVEATPAAAGLALKSAPDVDLLWHVESLDGVALSSEGADRAINPASVIKVGTSLWALERLGPGHRFETRFGIRGVWDSETGVVAGDLVVSGGADPDFHVENAYLVARALNAAGVREIRGRLQVDSTFWIGWEGGSERREKNAERRVELMRSRLQEALDPERWSRQTRRSLREFEARRGIAGELAPRVVIHGEDLSLPEESPLVPVLMHRSNPLPLILRRFNAYSNNDIERFEATLGTAAELARVLSVRWDLGATDPVRLATLSGLGRNRLPPRLVVRLLQNLHALTDRLDLEVSDILPIAGCDPGTLDNFPLLREGGAAGSLVAKTGSLTTTDGGVAVIAGFVRAGAGERVFCLVAPGSGDRLARAREAQERWILDLLERSGGASATTCGSALPFSDDRVEIVPGR